MQKIVRTKLNYFDRNNTETIINTKQWNYLNYGIGKISKDI